MISSQKDLDEALASKQCPAGLKPDLCAATRIAAKLNRELGEDNDDVEYALVDSGSSVHASCKKKGQFKQVKVKDNGRKLKCSTADGSDLDGDGGTQDVKFRTDEGNLCAIEFDQLNVSMPIISVQILTRKGNEVVFLKDRGYIRNLATGQVTNFIQREGVYFLKMMKCRTNDRHETSDFIRQGQKS